MEEPSVLDYLKSKLFFWRGEVIVIPGDEPALDVEPGDNLPIVESQETLPQAEVFSPLIKSKPHFPYRTIIALILAIIAQRFLEPTDRFIVGAIFTYTLAAGAFVWAYLVGEFENADNGEVVDEPMTLDFRWTYFVVSLPVLVIAFITFSGNLFNPINITLWIIGFALIILAFWVPRPHLEDKPRWKLTSLFNDFTFHIRITRWTIIVAIVIGLVLFFRLYRLAEVPGEMISDQAEKLLDVADVLDGQFSIFFPRNTGREAFQFYLTALIAKVFGTGVSFMSLKIGTVLAGLFALPYIYLIGKEIGNRWVGLFAVLLTGFSYWHNVISRFGLRFPLTTLFVAPTLFYFIRGLKRSNRNDLLLAGIALGIGLHGYTTMRIVPFLIVFGGMLYLLHRQSKNKRWPAFFAMVLLAVLALVVFLPLLRYTFENPDMISFRAFSRLGSVERPLPGPALEIFFQNLWRAMTMFFYDNNNIWVHSIPDRPALDVVSAALLLLGIVFLLVRYVRRRNWIDLFFLFSIPFLLMPSVLSLAFPEENPCLNRTSGAIVPVFIVAAIALERVAAALVNGLKGRLGIFAASIFTIIVFWASGMQNFDLVFNQYDKQFMAGAWNTSQIGEVMHSFVTSIGDLDSAYVVGFPHWVDTRLVGINSGFPRKDYAIWPENFVETQANPRAKLFIIKEEDVQSLEDLKRLYPNGAVKLYLNPLEGKNFYMFFVPPQS